MTEQFNTFICDQNVFSDISILDCIENENIFSVSLSCGGCRAYCTGLGIMRGIVKNRHIDNRKIPYISSVSGSSWLMMILSHCHKSFEEILLFDIDREYATFSENPLIDLCSNILPELDMLGILFIGTSTFANIIVNKFILDKFDLCDKIVCRDNLRDEWPTYIISSTYSVGESFYPIEYTPNYSLIGGEDVTLIVNDLNLELLKKIRSHIKEELCSCLEHNSKPITSTNMVASSSFIVNIFPYITSYCVNINRKTYNMLDGAYMDTLAIVPLLRRKCKKIFCMASCTLLADGKLDIKNWVNKQKDCYEDIFDNDQWNSIVEYANRKVETGELSYWRGNIDVMENSFYHTKEYTPEIIFFFTSRVTEFMNTLPILIANSPELKNFPNFLLMFQNGPQILAYTKLQSYVLCSYGEWAFNRIFDENVDFFSMSS